MAKAQAPIPAGRLWAFGVGAGVAAGVLNYALARAVLGPLDIPAAFVPLNSPTPFVFSVAGAIGATLVLALMLKRAPDGLRRFKRVALITLGVSFLPDLAMLAQDASSGVTVRGVIVLMIMHVIAYALIVGALVRVADSKAA